MTQQVAIVGAGLCGNLMAILLARQQIDVSVYERMPAPEDIAEPAGRSINLALAARGIRALNEASAFSDIEPLLLPMSGRIVHDLDGSLKSLPYGQRPDERIWSVSRFELNRRLIGIARDQLGVRYHFGHQCVDVDAGQLSATLRSDAGDQIITPGLLIAADGAGSEIRRRLVANGELSATESLLDHGYRELTIPARDGGFALDPEGLHIWPRGGFMLIALPNVDRSFTATLFLPQQGENSFEAIAASEVADFFGQNFPDATALMPDLVSEFASRPIGMLGTVRCEPWHLGAKDSSKRALLLMGDAAHAIVPFHGQGMNAAFEDCVVLAELAAGHTPDWARIAQEFEHRRRDNARAIAEMALENYEEMRDRVRDPQFEQRAALSFELERRFPGRFIPRYSMVMFHPEISYADAQIRGRIQASILDEALASGNVKDGLELASKLIDAGF